MVTITLHTTARVEALKFALRIAQEDLSDSMHELPKKDPAYNTRAKALIAALKAIEQQLTDQS